MHLSRTSLRFWVEKRVLKALPEKKKLPKCMCGCVGLCPGVGGGVREGAGVCVNFVEDGCI